jgi:hypothetical protein
LKTLGQAQLHSGPRFERRFAELSLRLDLLPDGKPRARSEFKFAGEKAAENGDEPVELPSLREARKTIN